MTSAIASDLINGILNHNGIEALIARHQSGDWGDCCDEDKAMNDAGLDKENPDRLMSVYKLPKAGKTIWIITEWDRSATTILYPEDY